MNIKSIITDEMVDTYLTATADYDFNEFYKNGECMFINTKLEIMPWSGMKIIGHDWESVFAKFSTDQFAFRIVGNILMILWVRQGHYEDGDRNLVETFITIPYEEWKANIFTNVKKSTGNSKYEHTPTNSIPKIFARSFSAIELALSFFGLAVESEMKKKLRFHGLAIVK